MYRKFDVTGNLLFAQYFFFEKVNTAIVPKLLVTFPIKERLSIANTLHCIACMAGAESRKRTDIIAAFRFRCNDVAFQAPVPPMQARICMRGSLY
jgi:hypothetical protein